MGQENGTAVSSVASRFLYAVQDGADIPESEIDTMRNVMANAYLGNITLLSDPPLADYRFSFLVGGADTVSHPSLGRSFYLTINFADCLCTL